MLTHTHSTALQNSAATGIARKRHQSQLAVGILLLTAFLLVWATFSLSAQPNATQPNAAQANGKSQGKIRVSAQVLDNETQKPVKGATLYMKHLGDGSITGDISDADGNVTVENAKPGRYYVAVSYLSFAKHKDTITVDPSGQAVKLGIIRLAPASSRMNEVSVTGEREAMELSVDKKVFNVSKNIASVGGTATDALKQVPTVDVDATGNISVRGSSNLIIQINGKQTGFAGTDRAAILDQIPANMIEKIEVITNPSARYDAEGMAGIINIITKTNIAQSWNGTATIGAGTNDKYNGSLDMGYRDGPLNASLGYSYRANRFNFDGGILQQVTNPASGATTGFLDQSLHNVFANQGHFLNLNTDYTIEEKITLSANAQLRTNAGGNNERIFNEQFDPARTPLAFLGRDNYTTRSWRGLDVGAGYKQTFTDKQHYLEVTGRYSANEQASDGRFVENDYNFDGSLKNTLERITNNRLKNQMSLSTAQADYVQPIQGGKVEGGLKATYRTIMNDLYADSLVAPPEFYLPNQGLINTFSFNELVLAAYAVYATKWENINIQAGLRVENTGINTLQVVGNERNAMNYANLFPSVHLSRKFEGGDELQLSYSRRINRPQFWALNPFPEYSNPTFLRKGNPALQPELIDAVEATYMKQVEGHTFTATAYFRQTDNLITPLFTVDANNVTTMRFTNLSQARNMGAEFIYRGQIFKWWTATANVNLFYNTLSGSTEVGDISVGNVTYTARLMSSLKMPWEGGNLQLTYSYNGPAVLAQGERKAFQDLTVGFRQDFGKELSVTFNVSDVFNTRLFNVLINTETAIGNSFNKPETRIATLNVSYRFGGMQEQRRPRNNGGDDMMQNGGGFGM
jgi:outer membrane receptor protein involved in Fe transport